MLSLHWFKNKNGGKCKLFLLKTVHGNETDTHNMYVIFSPSSI